MGHDSRQLKTKNLGGGFPAGPLARTVLLLGVTVASLLGHRNAVADVLLKPLTFREQDQIRQRLRSAVFRIDVFLKGNPYVAEPFRPRRDGACVAVTSRCGQRMLLTSCILVDGAERIEVVWGQKRITARVVHRDTEGALALLSVRDRGFWKAVRPLVVADAGSTRKFLKVFSIGHLGTGLEVVPQGEVLGRLKPPLVDYWAVTIPFPWGFPLVDRALRLQGINYRYHFANRSTGLAVGAERVGKYIDQFCNSTPAGQSDGATALDSP